VAREHPDPDELAAVKKRSGSRVSVVIPARDEETTVGEVAGQLVASLQRRTGLVDEVLVVDADSSDRTGAVAAQAGARVVRQADVLPELGTHIGKGEAMWKGLAASTGDLVVFVDADIVGIDERFVTGLLAPLLLEPDVSLVKAAYDRPIRTGEHLAPTGGGRVTELLARPLLAALWPELTWLTQPLAGECAARRSLLESLPFVRGYGVEFAMLVDVAVTLGPAAMRQVDLGRREHVHQSLDALGRMAAEILQVALQRATSQGRMTIAQPLGALLSQPFRTIEGTVVAQEHHVEVAERPPLRDVRGTARLAR
jgi:glucosyl-3-phosphoglycerate synthase